jgi:hypothetical protein
LPNANKSDGGENLTVNFIEAIVHHKIYHKANAIGGINYSNCHFNSSSIYLTDSSSALRFGSSSIDKNDGTLGLTIGIEYCYAKVFSFAAFYRPSLYSFGTNHTRQMLSIDARFNIYFWKK